MIFQPEDRSCGDILSVMYWTFLLLGPWLLLLFLGQAWLGAESSAGRGAMLLHPTVPQHIETVASRRAGSYGPPHSTLRFACPVLIWEPWLHLHLIGPCSHLPPESDSLGSCSICHPKVAALAPAWHGLVLAAFRTSHLALTLDTGAVNRKQQHGNR